MNGNVLFQFPVIQLIYFVKVAPGVQLSHCVIVCHCVFFFHESLQQALCRETVTWGKNTSLESERRGGNQKNKEITSFRKLMSFLFKVPQRCLPSSKVFFRPCDRFLANGSLQSNSNAVLNYIQAVPYVPCDRFVYKLLNLQTFNLIE